MRNLIHRANLSGRAECGGLGPWRLSISGVGVTCPQCLNGAAIGYAVKCDDCKQTMRYTESVLESYQGGQCEACHAL